MIAVCVQKTFFTWNTRVYAFATSCLHANTSLPKITINFIGTSSSPYTSNINLAILQGNLRTKFSWPVNPYLLQRSCFRHPRKLNKHQNVRMHKLRWTQHEKCGELKVIKHKSRNELITHQIKQAWITVLWNILDQGPFCRAFHHAWVFSAELSGKFNAM